MSYASDFLRWLQRKHYQYEVTFSLYMMTPTEKFIFSKLALPPMHHQYTLPLMTECVADLGLLSTL